METAAQVQCSVILHENPFRVGAAGYAIWMQNSLFALDPDRKTLLPLSSTLMLKEDFQEPRDLEAWLASVGTDCQIFGRKILWIFRQDRVNDEQRSDLVGIADTGDLVVAELKRGQLTDPAIAQGLCYAAQYRALTRDELTDRFLAHSQRASETRSLFVRVTTRDEAALKISGLVAGESVDQEVNGAQIVLLIAEEFSASVLKTCEYLNKALVGGGLLSIECWRYRLYKDSSGKLFFAIDKVVPQPELSEEIALSQQKVKDGKWARDPVRQLFIGTLKSRLAQRDGVEVTRKQGQSYEFDVRLKVWPEGVAVTVFAGREGPLRFKLPDLLEVCKSLPAGVAPSDNSSDRTCFELEGTDVKTLSASQDLEDKIVDSLNALCPRAD